MFRASLWTSSGEQDRVLPHMVFCAGCAGCGSLWLCGAASWVVCTVWRLLFDFTQCTQFTTQLHTTTANDNQHNQCRTPYAVVHGLILLMMGIMMPETCWDRSLITNIGLGASCWFLSFHPTFVMNGHKNLKLHSCHWRPWPSGKWRCFAGKCIPLFRRKALPSLLQFVVHEPEATCPVTRRHIRGFPI